MGHKYVDILGVGVDSTTKAGVLHSIISRLDERSSKAGRLSPFFITTPNPEIILAASSDSKLKDALNSADLSVPDGVGLRLASPNLKIIKGRDLFLDLVSVAESHKYSVFLLGSTREVNKKSISKLKLQFPNLGINGFSGPRLNSEGLTDTKADSKLQFEAIKMINKLKPKLLFVAFGHPKQEKWVMEHLKELNVDVVMVVGGTLDYIAGAKPIPPKWLESLGLEWFWRLIKEKGHYKRVYRALILFPIKVLLFH